MDIVIPFHPKDTASVRKCVISCRVFVEGCARIFLVSREDPAISGTIWVDEDRFPFSFSDIHAIMTAEPTGRKDRTGWYLQQLLKLYIDTVVEDLSPHYLIVDSDVVFKRPVQMICGDGIPCYAYGREKYPPYFTIMERLVPGLGRQIEDKSGICHHMVFSRWAVAEIRERICAGQGQGHNAWKVIMAAVDKQELSGFSEYELYFNYMLRYHADKIILRPLRWKDAPREMPDDREYDYVAYHAWMRQGA
jgi:hypothetical protein